MTTHDLTEWELSFLDHHRAKGHSPRTIAHYTDTFKRFRRFLAETDRPADSSALTTPVLQAFSAWMRVTPTRGCRGSTQRSVHGLKGNMQDMKAFTRWLQDEELIDWRIKVELPKLPEELFPILSDEEILRVWQSVEVTGDGEQKVRNRALLALMFDTGVRLSEVAGIELAQLDLDNYGVVVMGKGAKARRVPFSEGVAAYLRAWIRVRGDFPGSLFLFKPAGIRQLFRRIQLEQELPRFHPHQVRHQAATMLVKQKANLAVVKQILGHADISVTQRYLSMDDADIRSAHADASPFDKIRAQIAHLPEPGKRRLGR